MKGHKDILFLDKKLYASVIATKREALIYY